MKLRIVLQKENGRFFDNVKFFDVDFDHNRKVDLKGLMDAVEDYLDAGVSYFNLINSLLTPTNEKENDEEESD